MEQQFNFIKATLDSLPLPAKNTRHIYYDTRVPHLAVRVSANGHKSFILYRRVNGRPLKRTLGRYSLMTIEQARRQAESFNVQLSSGIDPLEKKREEQEEITLKGAFEQYLENYAKHHCKSWPQMIECFNRYLKELADRRVSTITHMEVQRLHCLLGSRSGHTTANRTIELLKAIINRARKWGLVAIENPCIGIEKFKLKPRQRFLMRDELPKIMKAIEQEPDRKVRDFILISLSTGVRKTNVLQMRWEQLDLSNGTWTIPDTKNGTSQVVLLTDRELGILKVRHQARRDFEWVFPAHSTSGHLIDPKKAWHRILKRAGIQDLHLHDLRRTLGSYMAMTGASLSVIGNVLNHKDLSTTRKVYAHTAREAERAAREIAHKTMFAGNEKSDDELPDTSLA